MGSEAQEDNGPPAVGVATTEEGAVAVAAKAVAGAVMPGMLVAVAAEGAGLVQAIDPTASTISIAPHRAYAVRRCPNAFP